MSAIILSFRPPQAQKPLVRLSREQLEEVIAHRLVEIAHGICLGDYDLAASALGRAYCLSGPNPADEMGDA